MRDAGLAGALLALGAVLRLIPLLTSSAPVPHPDEFNAIYWPLLVAMGDLSPEVFYYPYFHTYLLALVQLLKGFLVAPPDMTLHAWLGVQYFNDQESVLQVARWLQALCSCLTLLLVGGLARSIYGRKVALLALLLAAVSVLAVRQTPVAGLDVAMTMWFVAAVWAAVRLLATPTCAAYLLAGALTGLAASTKYHGGLAALPIVAAHLLAHRAVLDRRLWLAGVASLLVFVAGSPYTLLTPVAFAEGFGDLVSHARTGLLDLGPGWIHHVLLSLRVNLGWPGLAGLVVGLVLALRGSAAERVLATGFLGYYVVIGASPLVFVRYALPLAMLQCVLAAGALDWCARRAGRHAGRQVWALGVGLACIALPSAWTSVRVVDMLSTRDTRQQAADWIEAHVPAGTTLCNFGSWSADPPVRTVAGTWWRLRRYLQQEGGSGLDLLLPALERDGPRRPLYSYALNAAWQQYEAGDERAIYEFQCDYVLLNDHPLSPVRLDTAFVQKLSNLARREIVFAPQGWGGRTPDYDPIDAYYVPLASFGDVRQPGPRIEIWRVRGPVGSSQPQAWPGAGGARTDLARALQLGALTALEAGNSQDFAQLQQRAVELDPTVGATADYRRRLGWSYKRIGRPQAAAQQWRMVLQQDPANERLWLQLGLLSLTELDDPQGAARCFRRVLELDPQHPKEPLLRAFLQGTDG